MKQITPPLFFIFFITISSAQNVGIGTTTPSANAVLDVTSADKGIMLPRVNDTSLVLAPTAGLMIYNKNTKTPSYYNGTQWRSLSSTNAFAGADSMTYTIDGITEYPVKSFYQYTSSTATHVGGVGAVLAVASVYDFSFTKNADFNSIPFTKALFLGTRFTFIEFKFYKSSTTPFYSLKFTGFVFATYDKSLSAQSLDMLSEYYTINPTTIAFKNWVTSQSFSYNVDTKVVGTY